MSLVFLAGADDVEAAELELVVVESDWDSPRSNLTCWGSISDWMFSISGSTWRFFLPRELLMVDEGAAGDGELAELRLDARRLLNGAWL